MTPAARLFTDATGLGDGTKAGVDVGIARGADVAEGAVGSGVESSERIGGVPAESGVELKTVAAGELHEAAESTKKKMAALPRMRVNLGRIRSPQRTVKPVTFGILHRLMANNGAKHLSEIQGQFSIRTGNRRLQIPA